MTHIYLYALEIHVKCDPLFPLTRISFENKTLDNYEMSITVVQPLLFILSQSK